MKKFFFVPVLFLMLNVNSANSQEYIDAIGIRGGLDIGLNYKHFLTDTKSFEGILSTRYRGIKLTGLYEIQATAFDQKGLYWYYGGGAHLGYYQKYDGSKISENENTTVLGIDGILGLEYTIYDIPLSISLDWKPALNITGPLFWGDDVAISLRFRLN